MEGNNDKVYKPNAATSANSNITYEIAHDVQANIDKFRDPVVLGELIYKLLEERENTNRILKNILAKLERLEKRAATEPEKADYAEAEEMLIPEIDEKILEFVKQNGKVTADDVRAKFNYKGKNAASARMNRLCDFGLLRKKQVGKKVFFFQ
jgi:predicted HTH transcriptional regulator